MYSMYCSVVRSARVMVGVALLVIETGMEIQGKQIFRRRHRHSRYSCVQKVYCIFLTSSRVLQYSTYVVVYCTNNKSEMRSLLLGREATTRDDLFYAGCGCFVDISRIKGPSFSLDERFADAEGPASVKEQGKQFFRSIQAAS